MVEAHFSLFKIRAEIAVGHSFRLVRSAVPIIYMAIGCHKFQLCTKSRLDLDLDLSRHLDLI